jgi:transcriptional regulator with XRE-family HTH domain
MPPYSVKEVGARIREARLRCRLQQNGLAARLRIAPQELNRYECGRGGVPGTARLFAIAGATRTTVEWLLTGARHAAPPGARSRKQPDSIAQEHLLNEVRALRREVAQLKANIRTLQSNQVELTY